MSIIDKVVIINKIRNIFYEREDLSKEMSVAELEHQLLQEIREERRDELVKDEPELKDKLDD